MRILIALLILLAAPVRAEEIVLGLSQDEVAITATFEGSEILIFGAIKRDSPVGEGALGVIVTVSGPELPVTVRRKDKRLGIWVNTDDVQIDSAPSFYAVATSAPLEYVLRATEDLTARITLRSKIRTVGNNVMDSRNFSNALVRIRTDQQLYQTLEGSVDFEADTLFRTEIALPANLTEGDYQAKIYLTRDGSIVDTFETDIPVKKVGLERWLYNLAHQNALLYGLMSLAIAIASGWLASAVFSIFRR